MSRHTVDPPRSAGQTEIGLVRSSNQDFILLDDRYGLWLVADGMGGHAGGGEASRLASVTIQTAIRNGASLRSSILAAHYAIRAGQSKCPELAEMGTTVVALRECEDGFELAWVGDSRAYLFDRNDARLRQLTHDHNLAGLMVETGALSRAEAARHPRRHVLTDCLGLHGSQGPRIDLIEAQWQSGQLMLLCSDGLSGELTDDQISAVLADGADLDHKVQQLIQLVTAAGARDNVSVVLVEAPRRVSTAVQKRPGWRRWLSRPN
jgi:serine/threonine protein phosphatase PrpC